MKRILDQNINTKVYWDEVYGCDLYDLNTDNLKHQLIATQIVDGTRVVDYGCGPGEILTLIRSMRPHCMLVGVDQSFHEDNQATFIEGNVYTPVCDDANYVISTEVLEHLDYPERAIKCLYDSLEEGGTAFVSTPYLDHIPSREHIWEYDFNDMPVLFQAFTKVWVFPLASGRMASFADGRVYPPGNVDTILVRAIK